MSYDKKYRQRTIEYRESGHTLEETSLVFKVSISTIRDWQKLHRETGGFEKRPLIRSHKKVDPKELERCIEEHPDAYLVEIAEMFHCDESAIRRALKKLGITRKKNQTLPGTESLKSRSISTSHR
jgi:transposase